AQQPSIAAQAALAAACDAPLKALDLAGSGMLEQRARLFDLWPAFVQGRAEPVQAAEKLANVPLEVLIDWLYSWACDALKLTQSAPLRLLVNSDRAAQLQAVAQRAHPDGLALLVETLLRCRRQLAVNAQLNRQLLLEEVLIAWRRLTE
ncbi:DNA polymerase III subunit delta' C-terminal domain-containing protein, partial [Methylogaea oryzae]